MNTFYTYNLKSYIRHCFVVKVSCMLITVMADKPTWQNYFNFSKQKQDMDRTGGWGTSQRSCKRCTLYLFLDIYCTCIHIEEHFLLIGSRGTHFPKKQNKIQSILERDLNCFNRVSNPRPQIDLLEGKTSKADFGDSGVRTQNCSEVPALLQPSIWLWLVFSVLTNLAFFSFWEMMAGWVHDSIL